MQSNQNLWIGLLIGSGLTGLLMYILSQQANISETTAPTTAKTTVPVTTPFTKPAPATPAKTEAVKSETAEPQNIDLPGIPPNPRISEEELAKLSAKEREKYEETLATYHQVRDKVLDLHREREQLEQQIQRIIEENTTLDQQLDKIRQDHQND